MPAANHRHDVSDDSSGRRRNNSNAAREGRKRTLSSAVEESLSQQPRLELLKSKLERSGAARLQRLCDQLQLPAGLVYGDAAANEYGKPIGRTEAQHLRLPAEEDDRKLGVGIPQREVDVPRGSGTAVRDLSLHPEIAPAGFDLLPDTADEVRHSPDAALRHSRL
jgi:hypothetical protein